MAVLALIVATVLVAGVIAGLVERADRSQATAAPATARSLVVGINFGGLYLSHLAHESAAQQQQTLEAVRASGITSIRMDESFPSVEPTPDELTFPSTGLVEQARLDGLSIDMVLDYVPDWARAPDGSPRPAAYASYAAATVAHFAPLGVHLYELGNEENRPNGATPVDPADYTRLLIAAYPAIKRADPGATVLLGGLANALDAGPRLSALTFLSDVYADGGGGSFDGVAVHPDSSPVAPMAPAGWNPFYHLPELHAVSVRAGFPNTPVWITEYGAATSGTTYTVTPSEQASDDTAAYAQALRWPWVAGLYYFEWQDDQADGGLWGITTASGAPKPALNAIRAMLGQPPRLSAVPALRG